MAQLAKVFLTLRKTGPWQVIGQVLHKKRVSKSIRPSFLLEDWFNICDPGIFRYLYPAFQPLDDEINNELRLNYPRHSNGRQIVVPEEHLVEILGGQVLQTYELEDKNLLEQRRPFMEFLLVNPADARHFEVSTQYY